MADFFTDLLFGRISGTVSVNKYGENQDVHSTGEDVWTRGGLWVAPSVARHHLIVSDSVDDDSDGGQGAHQVVVLGLVAWDAEEVREVVEMSGTSGTLTENEFVIIHRMRVLTSGDNGPNTGMITAVAELDGTITAEITPGSGSTLMAIYGVPKGYTFYLTNYYASVDSTKGVNVSIRLLQDIDPPNSIAYRVGHAIALNNVGSSYARHEFLPYNAYRGPCVVKIHAKPSKNKIGIEAGFDGFLRIDTEDCGIDKPNPIVNDRI